MPTKQDTQLDPEQQEYERNFDFERHERELSRTSSSDADNPAEQASMDRGQAWSRDRRPVAEREAAPSWDTNVSGGGGEQQQQQQPSGGGGGGRFNVKNMLKKRANQWLIGSLVTLMITIAAAVPAALSGALAHLKELGSDWANRNNHSYYSKRTAKAMKKKYFQADADCNSGTKCRFKQGVNDKTLQKLKDAGLNPEVEKVGKKQYVKAFNTTDVEGNKVRVTADAFETHYSQNVRFRAQMDIVAKPKSMFLRGKTTLKLVFNKFGILRNRVIDGADDKEKTKNFRASVYGDGNDTEKAMNAPPGGEQDGDEAKKIAGVDDSINEAAQQERERLTSSGFDRPPSVIPDTTNLDLSPDRAGDVANGLLKGGVKGAVLGIFAAIDKACSGYQLIRAVVFGAKIYKALALIKYAALFMTIADKLKAGDSAGTEIAFIMAILFKPSNKKDSYGKTFFQSEGFNLMSQNKVADQRGLARFTNGSSFLKFMQGAKKTFEAVGANKSTCKHVQSWYGQASMAVLGLTLSIFSGGSLTVGGVVAGAAVGMIVSVLVAYVTPLLIQYAAGTIAPDPTDPEGGYGAGNAIAAGMGAFGNFSGRANGERVLTKDDAAAVEMETNRTMAFETKVENYGKSPFSMESASSIPSQLALAVAPIAASPFSQGALQTIASIATSPFSLFSSSLGNILTNGASAQSDIVKGGQFCADEDYSEINIAVDANCNPIPGEKGTVIDDPKYDPELVDKWMFDNGHADPESGELKSDDAKKYFASCTDGIEPMSPDGGGTDVTSDIDTRWCYSTEEKFTYFRFYQTNNSIDSSEKDSVEGTLGVDEGATETPLNGNTYENGKIPEGDLCELGPEWPGQKLRCDAADKFGPLNTAFKAALGKNIGVTDSYRTYDQQVKCKEEKGDLCAEPGKSNHGCGQALDLSTNINNFGSAEYNWMKANATAFGWMHPAWAEQGGSKPEPWHWEFGTDGNANNGTCQL
jgi:hypothetical protein